MAISIEMIKELRKATSAPMLDCKTALETSNGVFEDAVDYLREKGLSKAAKRSDRDASEGTIELYSHGGGRIGVIVEVNCETDFVGRSEGFKTFAHEIALQIAATAPVCVKEENIPTEVLEREAEVAKAKAIEDGKPENLIERIVDGRLAKYKKEIVLMSQPYIRDDSKTIADLLNENVAAMGENIVIRRFKRWELGESID